MGLGRVRAGVVVSLAVVGTTGIVVGMYGVGWGCLDNPSCGGVGELAFVPAATGSLLLFYLLWSRLSGNALALGFGANGVGLPAAAVHVGAAGWVAGAGLLAFGALVALTIRGLRRVRKEFDENARHGIATVLSVQDTNWTVNDRPCVRIRLRIQPSGAGRPFEDEGKHTVLAVPRCGERYEVRYGPGFVHLGELLAPDEGPDKPASASPAKLIDQLTKLDALRLSGALTEAEFQTQKLRVLATGPSGPLQSTPSAPASVGLVAEPGRDEYAHRFGGSEWSIVVPGRSFPPPVTLLTLELKDPRLELDSDLRALPLCSRVDGAGLARQVYVFGPAERTVTFEGPAWQVTDDPSELFPSPLEVRLLRLRELRPEEDPRHSPRAALDTFVGGEAFLRVRGEPPWLDDAEDVTCTCGRRTAFMAAIGYENEDHPSGLAGPDWPFFIGELARYFFACLPCRRVVVLTQPSRRRT